MCDGGFFIPATVVVGSQFGDEGKGKVVDFLAEKADLVARFNGGNNAGHTVVVKGKTYKFHLMPSGIIQGKQCCIGAGVALDPRVLKEELLQIEGNAKKRLFIDPRAQIIMPWHNALDAAKEKAKGSAKIGTTGRGIGPCYADRAERIGIRFSELADPVLLRQRIEELFPQKEKILKQVYGEEMPGSRESIFEEYNELGKMFRECLKDVSVEAGNAMQEGRHVLFEGAQGTFLDNDFGTYPFVTSSHPIAGGIFTGVGLGIRPIESVVGVAKAYTTRVGSGPFITELQGSLADKIREKGVEFGTTTGRPRRVGWLDLVLLRTAMRLNGFTEIALTKLDVLSGLDELNVCTAYKTSGKELQEVPAELSELEKCSPVYKKFSGFEITGKEKNFAELPKEAQIYVKFIEKQLGVQAKIVSIGPGREETIMR